MKRILKTIRQWLFERDVRKRQEKQETLNQKKVSATEIILDVNKRAVHSASEDGDKGGFRSTIHLEHDARVAETKSSYNEPVAKLDEQIAEDDAFLTDLSENYDELLANQIENMPHERHEGLDKKECEISELKDKVRKQTRDLELKRLDTPDENTGGTMIKRGVLVFLSLVIFGCDFVINQEIFEYIMGRRRLFGIILAPGMAAFLAFLGEYTGYAFARKSRFKIAISILVAIAFFTFLFIGQVQIGHGIYASCLVLVLFIAMILFSNDFYFHRIKSAPSRELNKAECERAKTKSKLELAKKQFPREQKALIKDAKNQLSQRESQAKDRLLAASKKRDGLVREREENLLQLSLLLKKLDNVIDQAFNGFEDDKAA